jgi:hypothetical protein
LDVPGNLVEELHEIDGMCGRANAVIEPIEICGVRAVIGRINILSMYSTYFMVKCMSGTHNAIPASRHMHASLEPSLTSCVGPSSVWQIKVDQESD